MQANQLGHCNNVANHTKPAMWQWLPPFEKLFGKPLDPFSGEARKSVALVALLAWVGLGADGLSSACYGPEEAFIALGAHRALGLYLACLTALTVFVIALAYNQVIELFPSGGGGYKVASSLLGCYPGLVSGGALVVDYVLTIAISVAAGADALFSLLPLPFGRFKLGVEIAVILLLVYLNLRGIKESIRVLLPIFIGFVSTHAFLILYGVAAHVVDIPTLIPATVAETRQLAGQLGWVAMAGLLLRAYSLGGGTYTGIEAVSNNVQSLAEPRIATGKWTMFYMAASLAFMAGGTILIYLLWRAQPAEGRTLNAVAFEAIIASLGATPLATSALLVIVLAFEAGLLLVAANTGFLGGPAVLANMAVDNWMPSQFRNLSSRLVTQNGVIVMGGAALGVLLITAGKVSVLVVLYSINVFLTFTLSLSGLVRYWWRHRDEPRWRRRLALSVSGLSICASILAVTVIEKLIEGGWITVIITGFVVALGITIRNHYAGVAARVRKAEEIYAPPTGYITGRAKLDRTAPTAAFIVGKSRSGLVHAARTVLRLWPGRYKNFLVVTARQVDVRSYQGPETLEQLKAATLADMNFYMELARQHGMASRYYMGFGVDGLEELIKLCHRVQAEFPNVVFFASKLVFEQESWVTRLLHNNLVYSMQRRLQREGMHMVILPMTLPRDSGAHRPAPGSPNGSV